MLGVDIGAMTMAPKYIHFRHFGPFRKNSRPAWVMDEQSSASGWKRLKRAPRMCPEWGVDTK